MWRSRILGIGLAILLVGSSLLVAGYLITPRFDQQRLPLFIAALSSLFSATGVIASWLVVLEMRRDRDELLKPDIFADFEMDEGLVSFVVRNDGQSSAKNVLVEVDPIPIGLDNQPIDNVAWLRGPIKSLSPGRKLEKVVDSHVNVFNDDRPKVFTINISYQSLSGKEYSDKPYQIDIEDYRNTLIPKPSIEASLKSIADSTKKIADG